MLEGMTRHRVRPPHGSVFVFWPFWDVEDELPNEEVLHVVVELVQRSVRAGRPTLIHAWAGSTGPGSWLRWR